LLALGEETLREKINHIGLFRMKAKHLIASCQRLIDVFDGQVPRTREDLESLPGVGRKTANVILNTVFGEPTIAVDTHIFRVANRTGLAPERTPLAVEKKLLSVIPAEYLQNAHHWLILHGRYTCTARKPACSTCLVRDMCDYQDKTARSREHVAG
jgi:endonuclease-3